MEIKCPLCGSHNIKYFENISSTYIYDIGSDGDKKGRGRKLSNFNTVDGYGYTYEDCGNDFRI